MLSFHMYIFVCKLELAKFCIKGFFFARISEMLLPVLFLLGTGARVGVRYLLQKSEFEQH
jgi:hypothetical protein